MAERALTTPCGVVPLIDLAADADAPLLRLCALLGRLQAITEELDSVIASIPPRTPLGRRMKELAL